jgi:3-isopropylmalate dehydrogenase
VNDKHVVVLPGDGIGPEVVAAALTVLTAAMQNAGVQLHTVTAAIGGAAIDAHGTPLTDATLEACRNADAALLGAVGGPKWDSLTGKERPEAGLLRIRRELDLWANLRPVRTRKSLLAASPLRSERVLGTDILFVRELTSGIYIGDKVEGNDRASDLCVYTRDEIARVVRRACELARTRKQRVTSVDKANVLATSRLWRRTATEIAAAEFPDVHLEHVLVDAMAMHLLQRPNTFDVVVTENLFGDVLTDEASMLIGSLGVLPSAAIGAGTFGLYEPVHGSAPDLAGQDVANPCGAIESTALLARYSLDLPDVADAIESAVDATFDEGYRTKDLRADSYIGCRQFARRVVTHLHANTRKH